MLQNYITLKKLLLSNPLMGTIKLSRYKFVSKMLDKNDVIIDVGCGGGFSTLFTILNFVNQLLELILIKDEEKNGMNSKILK